MSAVRWTSCLVCLRRFSFPLCRRWHPILCPDHAHLAVYDVHIGTAVQEVPDAEA